jgi:D-2-hydroxyacid dehydrogenase (NADP+)
MTGRERAVPRVVLHPHRPRGIRAELARLEHDGEIELVVAQDSDEVAAALADGADILASFRWEERYLQPSLRWVASISAGFEQYPLAELERNGVALTTASGVNAIAVAEHAMALLLGCVRRLDAAVMSQADRRWERHGPRLELHGSTMVVAGIGAIGERVAELATGFGMRVLGVKRDPDDYDGCAQRVVGPEELVTVCREADVLVNALPGGEQTKGLISTAVFDALDGGWLISVGRGSVVDEPSLVEALEDGRIRGAGLDVFAGEPLDEGSPLWALPGVLMTAHVGGLSPNYGRRWVELFRRNLAALTGRQPWTNRVT